MSSNDNIVWSVPTQIPLKVTAQGNIIGPDPKSIAIKNLSSFSIRVEEMDFLINEPFNLTTDIANSKAENAFQISFNGVFAQPLVLFDDDGKWTMGYKDAPYGTDTLPLTYSDAKLAQSTIDLSQTRQLATITWKVGTAQYVKPDPKPNQNGTAFAVYSADDNSLRFYKRDYLPKEGTKFNNRIVTQLYQCGREWDEHTMMSCWRFLGTTIIVEDEGIKPLNMESFISNNKSFISADLRKFDFSECTSFNASFANSKIQTVNLSETNLSKVATFNSAFHSSAIKQIDFTGCIASDNSVATDMSFMFVQCNNLTNIDFARWKVKPFTTECMFVECSNLATVKGLNYWDTSKLTRSDDMFLSCTSLVTIDDLSDWNMSKNTQITSMFHKCTSLTYIGDISNWDVSHVTDMSCLFIYCGKLTNVGDLSKWNVSNVTNMSVAFYESGLQAPSWYKW